MAKLRLIILLSICAWPAMPGDPSSAPPLGPDGETAAPSPPSQGIERCLGLLRQTTSKIHDHLDRSVVTFSPRWGLLFRADFSSESDPPVRGRFVCPINSAGPAIFSFEPNTPPLASGPWGRVTSYR